MTTNTTTNTPNESLKRELIKTIHTAREIREYWKLSNTDEANHSQYELVKITQNKTHTSTIDATDIPN